MKMVEINTVTGQGDKHDNQYFIQDLTLFTVKK